MIILDLSDTAYIRGIKIIKNIMFVFITKIDFVLFRYFKS